jgi:hypothetical protein
MMTEVEDDAGSPGATVAPDGRAYWISRALLVVWPLLLAMAVYYPAQLAGKPWPRLGGDAAFYAYQLMRVAECHGQWWRIEEDDRLGHPYPTEFAKHPGLFEGLDLMLLATLAGVGMGPASMYHLAVLATLAFNGWIAAWIVLRLTRSPLWAAAAVALITLNQPVAARILGHLHLFKLGWILLGVWAFVAFLERPTWRRGLGLGVASALMLQASFYLGFLLLLGLGAWYVRDLLSPRPRRGRLAATAVAAIAFAVLGGAFCFPVWTRTSEIAGSGEFFHHDWFEAWTYGAELWKYVVPRGSPPALAYEQGVRTRFRLMDEGWNFPGFTVLLAVLIVSVSRLRGAGVYARLRPFATVGLGLMAIWTVLSLSGGPAVLLFPLAPSFRCYGRAGLFVVALGSVLAPVILCELVRSRGRRPVRAVLTLAALALVANDARLAARWFPGWVGAHEPPAWVDWLERQPPDVRLAAFPVSQGVPFEWWGRQTLEWLPMHGHATLNGANFALLEGDLRLLGGSFERINPAGLRLVVSLGYETMAFHRDYLAANPWIAALPWLDRVEERGGWLICRANARLTRLPERSLDELLDRGPDGQEPGEVPPNCWITGSWPVAEDVMVGGSEGALMAWTDERGRPITPPRPSLYQHVFGPSVPAYSARTPTRPGTYRLVFFDRRLRPRAALPYRIVPDLAPGQPPHSSGRPDVTVQPITLGPGSADRSGSLALTLENRSSRYLIAQVNREFLRAANQAHPGLRSRWEKLDAGAMVLRIAPVGAVADAADAGRELPLPADLPPGGRLKLVVPADRWPSSWKDLPLRVLPTFARVGHVEAAAGSADLTIAADRPATEIARPLPPPDEVRSR